MRIFIIVYGLIAALSGGTLLAAQIHSKERPAESIKNKEPGLADTTDVSLHLATMDGNLDKVRQLLKQGKNINGVSALSVEDPKNPGIKLFDHSFDPHIAI